MHLVRNRRWWRSSDGAWFAPKGIWRWRRRAHSWCWNRIHKFSASSRFRDFGVRMPICIGQGTQSRNLRYGVRVLTTCLSTLVNFLTKSELTWFLKMGYLWWRNLWTRGWCPVVGTWFTRHVVAISNFFCIFAAYFLWQLYLSPSRVPPRNLFKDINWPIDGLFVVLDLYAVGEPDLDAVKDVHFVLKFVTRLRVRILVLMS